MHFGNEKHSAHSEFSESKGWRIGHTWIWAWAFTTGTGRCIRIGIALDGGYWSAFTGAF